MLGHSWVCSSYSCTFAIVKAVLHDDAVAAEQVSPVEARAADIVFEFVLGSQMCEGWACHAEEFQFRRRSRCLAA